MATECEPNEDWEPPEDFDATESVIKALLAHAKGEDFDRDEYFYACTLLAAGVLMKGGLDADRAVDTIEKMVQEGARLRATYENGELSITMERLEDAAEA